MTSTLKRRSLAVIMTLLMCFSMFASFGITAQAAGERSEIYMISFPAAPTPTSPIGNTTA